MDKEIGLFPLSKPQIEDPGRGLDGTSLTKDGIAGDSIGNNSPSKEEEMQSTAHAELDEKLSDGENLQMQALQPLSGDKAEFDDRAATEGKRIDEEEGTVKEMMSSLSGRQESVTLISMASSGPVKLNSAFNCNENETVSSSSPPSLAQHKILERKDMLQQAQVVSFKDIKSCQSIQYSALSRTSTTDGGKVLNIGNHFGQENGADSDSLENGGRHIPTTCDIPPSDSATTKKDSVEEEMVALHATTTKYGKTLNDEQAVVNVDKLLTSSVPQEAEEHIALRKGEPSETNDTTINTTTYPEPEKDDETLRSIVDLSNPSLTNSNHDMNGRSSTRVFENESTMRLNEAEANNTALSSTEADRKDIILLEENHPLSEGDDILPPTQSVVEINLNSPVNCSSSDDSDESMLEGDSSDKVSKKDDFMNGNNEAISYQTMLISPGLKDDRAYAVNLGAAPKEEYFQPSATESSGGILNKTEEEEEINCTLPNAVIEKAGGITADDEGGLLEPSLPFLELSQEPTDEAAIRRSASYSDIEGIDSDVHHNLELFASEQPEEGGGDNLLERHDQLGPHNAHKSSSHSLSPNRSEGRRCHGRTIMENQPALTIDDVFQSTSTVTTPQDINDFSSSDEMILTPRSAKACAINGVNPVLLRKRNLGCFWEPDIDTSIQKLKYDMYNRRRYQLMKICCNEKARLEEEEGVKTTQANAAMLQQGKNKGGLLRTQQQRLQNGKENTTLSVLENEKRKLETMKKQRLKEAEQQLAWEMKKKEMEEKIRAREEKEAIAVAKLEREKKRRQRQIAEERRMREIRKKAEIEMETEHQQIFLREEHEKSLQLAQAKQKDEKKAKEQARLREQEAMENAKRFKMQTQLFFEQKRREALAEEAARKEKEELRKLRVSKQRKTALDVIAAKSEKRKKRIEMNVEHNEVSIVRFFWDGVWGDRVIDERYTIHHSVDLSSF